MKGTWGLGFLVNLLILEHRPQKAECIDAEPLGKVGKGIPNLPTG